MRQRYSKCAAVDRLLILEHPLMTCLMQGLADAWVVLLQVQSTELQRVTRQLAEEQSMVEVKQAEISKLADRVTGSQQEVAALQEEHASAVKANSAAAQVGNI